MKIDFYMDFPGCPVVKTPRADSRDCRSTVREVWPPSKKKFFLIGFFKKEKEIKTCKEHCHCVGKGIKCYM